MFANRGATSDQLSFSEFQSEVAAGNVDTANFLLGDGVIEGELSDGTPYRVAYVQGTEETLTEDLQKNGVDISADPQKGSALVGFLFQLIPVILIVGAFIFIMNQSQGGGGRVMQFGKARAKLVTKDQPKTTFADVAGVDEAIEELQEVKEYLANPAKFQAMGAKIPRGVLLFGPPGSGKTLLARAVAGEAGVPFYSISGSDFVEMFVGVGAARVRDLFEQAKQSAPAIVFIDEIDAVGRHRGAGLGGGHDEREQTLNQLLVEMDGFDQRTAVILMAATNRPDILDPALLRPGRFDRQIVVDRPDLEGRKGILKVHARGKPFDETVDLSTIARRTPGFTGADLSNVINESALLAARWGKKAISMKEVEEAIDRVMAGPERKTRVMSEREKRVIAYHEGGHALVAHILPNTDPVHKISVIPRGRALGYTLTLPEEDKFLMTREELADELAMLMGGRVAEELIVGDITTGAANDIERATKVARADGDRVRDVGHARAADPGAEAARGLPRPGLPVPARLLGPGRVRDRQRGPPDDRRGPRRGARHPAEQPRQARRARDDAGRARDPRPRRGRGVPVRHPQAPAARPVRSRRRPRRLPAGDPDGRAAEHPGHDPAQAHRLGFAARWPWTAGRRSTATGR